MAGALRARHRGVQAFLIGTAVPFALGALGCEDGGAERNRDIGSAERDGGSEDESDAGIETDASVDHGDAGATLSTPSNVAPEALETAEAGDVVLKADRCILDTTKGVLEACGYGSQTDGLVYSRITMPGTDREAALFVVKSLRIEPGAKLHVAGNVPAIIYAQQSIDIHGTVDGYDSIRLPAGSPAPDRDGRGAGEGGGEAYQLMVAAGGGGSYCGVGGKGASFDPAVGARGAGATYGTPELTPLMAGSGGGGASGMYPTGGLGGPAIQLSAGSSITVFSAGAINVGGNGGGRSAGGGSGGALLIEAPTVTIRGGLFANGGAGGLGHDNSTGQDGPYSDARAQGKGPTAGQGSHVDDVNGTDGTISDMLRETGGGGGGAGRIRINTRSGEADVAEAVIISPALGTACTTQVTL